MATHYIICCDFQCYNHDRMLRHTQSIYISMKITPGSVYIVICVDSFPKVCTLKKYLYWDHHCKTGVHMVIVNI